MVSIVESLKTLNSTNDNFYSTNRHKRIAVLWHGGPASRRSKPITECDESCFSFIAGCDFHSWETNAKHKTLWMPHLRLCLQSNVKNQTDSYLENYWVEETAEWWGESSMSKVVSYNPLSSFLHLSSPLSFPQFSFFNVFLEANLSVLGWQRNVPPYSASDWLVLIAFVCWVG